MFLNFKIHSELQVLRGVFFVCFFNVLILERGREKHIDLFHLFVHSLIDSCLCPDQGSNLQC